MRFYKLMFILVALVAIAAMLALYYFLKNEGFLGQNIVIIPPAYNGCNIGMPWWAYMMYCTGGQQQQQQQQTTTASPSNTIVPDATTKAPSNSIVPDAAASPTVPSDGIVIPNDGVIDTDWNNWKYEVKGKRLHLNDQPIRFRGVNWYGFEEMQMLPELMFDVSLEQIFQELFKLKINGLRIALSAEFMQYFDNKDCKVGLQGVVITSGAVYDHTLKELFAKKADGTRYIVKDDKKLELAPADNKNVCKFSYIADPKDKAALDGKTPAEAMDYFLKMAYKYNMLVKFDLHTMKATPPWNDHVMNAGYELVTPDANKAKLKDLLTTIADIKAVQNKPGTDRKIADFAYPDSNPVWMETYKYRDITQKELLQFTSEDIAKLWAKFAKWCMSYPHVFAFDFKNEPHDFETDPNNELWQGKMADFHGDKKVNWENWSAHVNKCYDAVAAVHPHCCYVISGLHDRPGNGVTHGTCWGAGYSSINGDLDLKTPDTTKHPKETPIDQWKYLPKNIPKNRRIWGPHQYGSLASKEDSTSTDWDFNWGFLSKLGECVTVDEWGLTNNDHVKGLGKDTKKEKDFTDALTAYIATNEMDSFYFAVNYTSADTEPVVKGSPGTVQLNSNAKPIVEGATPDLVVTSFDFSSQTKVKKAS